MQDFINQWLGGRIDYDGVYGYQCVDLIKQYLDQLFGIKAGAWGDAKDYWLSTNPAILIKFDKLPAPVSPCKPGDIVVLKPIDSLAEHRFGHIAIAADGVNMLEQNGSTGGGSGTGADGIRLRAIPYPRLYGVLRPKKGESMQPTAKQVGDVYRFMTDAEISQKDLDFYITPPRTIYDLIYALGADTQRKVKNTNLNSAQQKLDQVKKIINE